MSASVQDTRSFRDFRRRDKLDVRFGMEWQTAEVLEVNWEDPCQNTISLQHLFLSGHLLAVAPTLFCAQRSYLQGDDCACPNDSAELGDSSQEFLRIWNLGRRVSCTGTYRRCLSLVPTASMLHCV